MTLQWQKIEVPFGFGVDQKAHKFIAAPPGVASLGNGRIDKDGQINVREGWEAAASRSNTEKLIAYKDRLYAVYSDPSSTTNNVELSLDVLNNIESRFDKQGGKDVPSALTECTIDGREIIARDQQSSFGGSDIGIHEASNLAVIAWVAYRPDPGLVFGAAQRIYATVIDINTLATVTPIQEISTGAVSTDSFLTGVRIVIEGTVAYVLYVDVNANTIRTKEYNLGTRAWSSNTALETDIEDSPTPVFDAAEGGQGVWYLAYRTTANQMHIHSYLGTTFQNQIVLATEDPLAIAIYANTADDRVWVMWNDNVTDIKYAVYDTDLVQVVAPSVIETTGRHVSSMGIARMSSAQALFVYTLRASTLISHPTTRFFARSDAAVGTLMSRYSVTLESRPITDGAHVYAVLGYRSSITPQPAGFQSLSAFYTVALVGTGDAFSPDETTCYRTCALWAQGSASSMVADVLVDHGTLIPNLRLPFAAEHKYWFTAAIVATVENRGVDADGKPRLVQEAGVDLCRFELSSNDRNRYAEFGQHLFLAGGQTVVFDGANIVEHGFHYPPEDTIGTIDVGGGVLTDGTYAIMVAWEYRMNSGAVMRSQPCLVTNTLDSSQSFVVAANDAIDIQIQHLNLTQKFNPYSNITATNRYFQAPALVVYRTEANGSVFYREGQVEINDVFGETTLGSIKVGDSVDDDELKASEQLYTINGTPNWTLPACDDFVVYKNRLFGISSEDKKQLVFTQVLNDSEVPAWHPFLVHRIDDDGDCVGLAVLDDSLVVFKENAVYLVRGNGPDVKGLNSDFTTSRVQSPHGCIERRSIVSDPLGVYFRARQGLMRLTRSLQVEYVGEKIDDYLPADVDIITSATLPNYTERLYFGITDNDSTNGFLVYQWNNDQWAVDTMNASETGTLVPLSIVWVAGVAYCAFQGESNIYAHQNFEDPHDEIQLAILSHWFKFDGAQGFKRIRNVAFLGEWHDDHNLLILFYRDYLDTPFQSITFTSAELDPSVIDPYQIKLHVAEQRMESFRYAIVVDPDPSDGFDSRCVTWVAQAFDVGIKPTIKRMPDAAMRG